VKKKDKKSSIPAGYVSFEHVKRRLLRDKKAREAYEAMELEDKVIRAIIHKRIEKKLTQAQVATRANMKQSAVARFETGNESPTLETTSRILAAVGAKVRIS
jgi:DNA-binding XRE family transcriptional regulator